MEQNMTITEKVTDKYIYGIKGGTLCLEKGLVDRYSGIICPVDEEYLLYLIEVFGNISQTIPGKCRLALLSFEYQPEVYVWAMQLKSRHICTDAGITDEEMRLAVRGLNIKYSYASSNGINKSNIEIIVSWAGFINRDDPKPTVNCYVLSP